MAAQQNEGFTLIEALVALVILAVAVGGFYRSLELNARGARIVVRDAAALAVARQRLNEATASVNQGPRVTSGDTADGIHWTQAISARAAPANLSGTGESATSLQLYRIDVRVAWRDIPGRPSRELVLTTFKRAAVP